MFQKQEFLNLNNNSHIITLASDSLIIATIGDEYNFPI